MLARSMQRVSRANLSSKSVTDPVALRCCSATPQGFRIVVEAQPGASESQIVEVGEALRVRIAARPIEGEANIELCRYLASVLGVRKTSVKLDRGARARHKAVLVECADKPSSEDVESMIGKLKQLVVTK